MKSKYITPVSRTYHVRETNLLTSSPNVTSDDSNQLINSLTIDTEGDSPKIDSATDIW